MMTVLITLPEAAFIVPADGDESYLALLEAPPVVAALPEVAAPLPEDPLQPAPPPQLASTKTRAATASVPFIFLSPLLVEVG
jgi:hypothetical protein